MEEENERGRIKSLSTAYHDVEALNLGCIVANSLKHFERVKIFEDVQQIKPTNLIYWKDGKIKISKKRLKSK